MTKTAFSKPNGPLRDGVHCERARRANRCAAELLLTIGVPPHTKGFHLLQAGAMLLEEQPNTRRIALNDTLYPLAEQLAGGTASAERAVRDTIRLTTQSKTPPAQALFPTASVPTNAEMLYALSAQLRKMLREGS